MLWRTCPISRKAEVFEPCGGDPHLDTLNCDELTTRQIQRAIALLADGSKVLHRSAEGQTQPGGRPTNHIEIVIDGMRYYIGGLGATVPTSRCSALSGGDR